MPDRGDVHHNAVTTKEATLAQEKGHYWNDGWNWNKVFRCAHSSPWLQEARTSGMLGEGCMGSFTWFLQLLGADLNCLKMKVFFRDHKINRPWELYARTRGGPRSAKKDWPRSIASSKPRTWPSRDTQNPGSQPTRHAGFRAESSETSYSRGSRSEPGDEATRAPQPYISQLLSPHLCTERPSQDSTYPQEGRLPGLRKRDKKLRPAPPPLQYSLQGPRPAQTRTPDSQSWVLSLEGSSPPGKLSTWPLSTETGKR